MSTDIKPPIYMQLAQIIIGIVGFFFIIYIGQDIIVPLAFATLVAILLNPLVNYLAAHHFNRVLSIFIVLFIALILTSALIYFLASQAAMFSDAFPQLKLKFEGMLKDTINYLSQNFNLSKYKINAWINKTQNEAINNASGLIGGTLSTLSGFLVIVLILPVYIFMILYYKPLLLDFIAQLFPNNQIGTVVEVLKESKSLIQNYLFGLLVEMIIVAILNSVALLLLGVESAVLLGVIGALLNLIPYIGGVVGIALPMIMALATQSPITMIYVALAYLFVQFIDNNYLVPYIVASRVKLNALVSIIVVFIGGALWGIPGMFLFLPITAITKIIFDRIEPLKPFGFLLGDTMPPIGKDFFKFKRAPKKT